MKRFTIALALAVSFSSFAQSEKWKNETRKELDSVLASFEMNYGPLAYKKDQVGPDWEAAKGEIRADFEKVKNLEDYHSLLTNVIGRFKDAHVSLYLPMATKYHLPIQFSYVEGKTILNFIERAMVPRAQGYDFEIGDELVSFDGLSPEDARAQILNDHGIGNKVSDLALSTRYLTDRNLRKGYPAPQGKTAIVAIKRGDKIKKYAVTWSVTGSEYLEKEKSTATIEGLKRERRLSNIFSPETLKAFNLMNEHFNLLAGSVVDVNDDGIVVPGEQKDPMKICGVDEFKKPKFKQILCVFKNAEQPEKDEGNRIDIGHVKPLFKLPENFKRMKLPALLKKMVAEPKNLFVGTFKRGNSTIGYMRISSYMPSMDPEEAIMSGLALRYYMSKLQQKTDALIIDQIDNPGGMVTFSDWLVSHLTTGNYEFKKMTFQARPNLSWIHLFSGLKGMIGSSPDIKRLLGRERHGEYMARIEKGLVEQRKAFYGGAFTTPNVDLTIISEIYDDLVDAVLNTQKWVPMSGRLRKTIYTKPVTMVINELCFSAGDATPAVLQDNGRVKLIGVTTAGAGGNVVKHVMDSVNSFEYTVTRSLMYRSSGKYVENVGVRPDEKFSLTIEDYKNGFNGVLERIIQQSNFSEDIKKSN